ncbi:MAG: hypothetical protein AAGD96_22695, partial [Chloroflexota bacterium]
MASITKDNAPLEETEEKGFFSGLIKRRFNMNYFIQDNITGSTGLLVWIVILTSLTLWYMIRQFSVAPGRTGILVGLWTIALLSVVTGELFGWHNAVSRWLKENLITTVSNALIT